MKTVFDIMDKSENGLMRFDAAISDAYTSKFIVADKRISEILQTIAGSVYLYDLINECTKGFDFQAKTDRILLDNNGNLVLDLSLMQRRERIAYVFALLYSFDIRANELLKFIQRFFGSNNVNNEYTEFCRQILVPFREDILTELAESNSLQH